MQIIFGDHTCHYLAKSRVIPGSSPLVSPNLQVTPETNLGKAKVGMETDWISQLCLCEQWTQGRSVENQNGLRENRQKSKERLVLSNLKGVSRQPVGSLLAVYCSLIGQVRAHRGSRLPGLWVGTLVCISV